MIIDEHIQPDGTVARVSLERDDDDQLILIAADGEHHTLSDVVVIKVMRHYGRPLDDDVSVDGEELSLLRGASLVRFQFRARVDASARDYLALREPGREVIGTLSQGVAAALQYLGERLSAADRDA